MKITVNPETKKPEAVAGKYTMCDGGDILYFYKKSSQTLSWIRMDETTGTMKYSPSQWDQFVEDKNVTPIYTGDSVTIQF